MFIYTFKASSIKFFAVIFLSVVILVSLILILPDYSSAGDVAVVSINYNEVKTNEDKLTFIKQFGYEVENTPIEEAEVLIPAKFDSVYEKYNEIQRAQGLNLKKYAGKNVMKSTYVITNYPNYEGRVLLTLIVFKNRIIAGDVVGVDNDRFVHGFELPQNKK